MKKILIIQARFYDDISDKLLDGATQKLTESGFEYDIIDVMGALEIAAVISIASKAREYDGFIALGCVIRGETSHYDIVANESARLIGDLATKKRLAVGNGILTVENREQALARADRNQKDKGGFAAEACIKMIEIKQKFKEIGIKNKEKNQKENSSL